MSARDTMQWSRSVLYRDAILEVTVNEIIIDKQRLLRFPWSSPVVIRIKDIECVSYAEGGCLQPSTRTINLKLRAGAGCKAVRPEKPIDAYQALLIALGE